MNDQPTANSGTNRPVEGAGRLRRAWTALTDTKPTTTTRPAPAGPTMPTTPVDWSGLGTRARSLQQWSAKALTLAAEHQTQPTSRPSKPKRSGADRLRYIPPVAALGTAFVLQTVAVTDVVGGALTRALAGSDVRWMATHAQIGYLVGALLGTAVASCAEGGAAYLMDLYDKHLLARDSVWMLRLGMIVYVALSAGAIHWWTTYRQLPTITSWLLAGMSASALFLWSRGSRWRNRVAMRAAGQLDPALPKLPAQAKLMHPIRTAVTLYLVSWEPAATTDEARARYESWHRARVERKATAQATGATAKADRSADQPVVVADPAPEPTAVEPVVVPTRPAAEPTTDQPTTDQPTTPVAPPATARLPVTRPAVKATTKAKPPTRPLALVHGPTAIADAAFLWSTYGDAVPGRNELYRVHGGNAERWSKARKAYADRAYEQADAPASDDEPTDRAFAAGGVS